MEPDKNTRTTEELQFRETPETTAALAVKIGLFNGELDSGAAIDILNNNSVALSLDVKGLNTLINLLTKAKTLIESK